MCKPDSLFANNMSMKPLKAVKPACISVFKNVTILNFRMLTTKTNAEATLKSYKKAVFLLLLVSMALSLHAVLCAEEPFSNEEGAA